MRTASGPATVAGRHASGRAPAAAVLAASTLVAALLTGCTGSSASATSVFEVEPGQCFDPPAKVEAQLSSINRIDCAKPHTQEAYAIVDYAAPSGGSGSGAAGAFPGADALTTFAQGRCAQEFTRYVGIDYLDSTLYFTYLLPSARGWEQDEDRKVICFVTTTGEKLTASVKGSKR